MGRPPKLTPQQQKEARRRRAEGETLKELAKSYNVGKSTISRAGAVTAIIGLAISILALAVSAVTAWITLFRRGRILMTQPTVIYFGPDGSRFGIKPRHRKVFFFTLLYSTGKRGQIIENMFVSLRRGETRQNFNVWVYGDDEWNGEEAGQMYPQRRARSRQFGIISLPHYN